MLSSRRITGISVAFVIITAFTVGGLIARASGRPGHAGHTVAASTPVQVQPDDIIWG
jgi:hypothetical protein